MTPVDKNGDKKHDKIEYLQYNDEILHKLKGDQCADTPTPFTIRHNQRIGTRPIDREHALSFILIHFQAMDFPRKISTKTTEGRQISVDDKPQALARFEQANWLDCRISAYTEADMTPNFVFVDIDCLDPSVLKEVLNKCRRANWNPTVLFTGRGYHIYQPVEPVQLRNYQQFSEFSFGNEDLATLFLRVAANYISGRRKDCNHNPSLKSCMVRVPGSINNKNGQEVMIVQEWDGKRPSIIPLLGIFYSALATKKIQERKYENSHQTSKTSRRANINNKVNWIEKLLKTPIEDYRKIIVNLILAPYLINIRRLGYEVSMPVIKRWLKLCAAKRNLDFNVNYIIGNALHTAKNSGYRPMRLDTLKDKYSALYKMLGMN